MSWITAWETGTSGAPNAPWRTRNTTRAPSESASPQASDAAAKPTTQPSTSRRRPKRETSHPDIGVATAVATMLKVTTQAI